MTTITRTEAWDVQERLAELGLEEEPLRNVARSGYLAYINCTANHPPLIPGILAWGETVRALREYLLPIGWRRSDENNYSLAIDPSGRIAIAVATGDDGTGLADTLPSTKSSKGPCTIDAVATNQLQFGFMEPETAPIPIESVDQSDERTTMLLLTHRTQHEVRSELSIPSSIGPDGRVDGWNERIILGSVPIDGDLIDVIAPTLPEITIDVKRRA